jgi:exodeoxyribonuclease III
MIIPIAVTDGNFDFTMYVIWAKKPYIEQVWDAIQHYDNYLSNRHVILIGDFNSNKIWDKKHGEKSHSNVVKHLDEKGIYSCYHCYYKQQQGEEQLPTYFHCNHREKPYHIDYCFVSKDLLYKLRAVEVGDYDSWSQHSDHVPLIVNFNIDGYK